MTDAEKIAALEAQVKAMREALESLVFQFTRTGSMGSIGNVRMATVNTKEIEEAHALLAQTAKPQEKPND